MASNSIPMFFVIMHAFVRQSRLVCTLKLLQLKDFTLNGSTEFVVDLSLPK